VICSVGIPYHISLLLSSKRSYGNETDFTVFTLNTTKSVSLSTISIVIFLSDYGLFQTSSSSSYSWQDKPRQIKKAYSNKAELLAADIARQQKHAAEKEALKVARKKEEEEGEGSGRRKKLSPRLSPSDLFKYNIPGNLYKPIDLSSGSDHAVSCF